jgi:hypothetical protein
MLETKVAITSVMREAAAKKPRPFKTNVIGNIRSEDTPTTGTPMTRVFVKRSANDERYTPVALCVEF